MTEAIALATSAVTLVTPLLGKFGEGVATKLGEVGTEVGVTALGWMRRKLTGHASEALSNLEQNPKSLDNQANLRTQLAHLLEVNPTLFAELAELMPDAARTPDSMQQRVDGTGTKAVQIKGDNNSTSIS